MATRRFPIAMIGTLGLLAADPASAQQSAANVTLRVPLNLTQLVAQVTKVSVKCELWSPALPGTSHNRGRLGETEMAVAQGQVVGNADVVIVIDNSELVDPAGKAAGYSCQLYFFVQSLNQWVNVSVAPAGTARANVNNYLTALATPVTGTFNW